MKNLEEIKSKFYSDGFVIVKNIFNQDQLKKIFKEIELVKTKSIKVKNKNMHFTKDKKLNTIHDINTYVKKGEIINFTKNKNLVKVVNKILGEKSKVRNIEFFLKPKKTGLKAPFHQDNFYWKVSNKRALNVWIACSQSNRKNGGMCYFKKSHKIGLIEHQLSGDPGSSQKLSEKFIEKLKFKKIYPNLNKGDCIIHHCEVIHGSSKNKSNKDRIGLVISYIGKRAKINKKKVKEYRKLVEINLRNLKN